MQAELTLLIVEDDDFQRHWLARLCQPHARRIEAVADGHAALRLLDTGLQPDMVLMDLGLPGMDGVCLLAELARRQLSSALVLISVASAEVMESVATLATLQGLDLVGQFRKPVARQQICELLQSERVAVAKPDPRQTGVSPSAQVLRQGLEQGDFQPYFQPQVCAQTGRLMGVEALARWVRPGQTVVGPAGFLDEMDAAGLGHRLTMTMLAQSLACCQQWRRQGLDLNLSVNIAPDELLSPALVEEVLALLVEYDFPPQRLCLEITETQACRDLEALLSAASRLRLHGVGLALDDFGTGHASLLQLIQTPACELKIDRAFVARMLDNPRHRAAVETTLALAARLKLRTVAEGVETQAQAALLARQGCQLLQGYLYSPPVPAETLLARWG
ncbi:EAL domain-containing response regulator [Pseudaeromonas sp. ZJS20]|uniref:EAL domain-containing response regulator n=1 Tax=Pseudaeromonas aegiceratis TaxID=3153928 RepID=UPI00390C8095